MIEKIYQITTYIRRLPGLLEPVGNLTDRTIKSGFWATFLKIFDRVFQLVKLIILARLLAPSDFGLMGIAMITLTVFQRFSSLGINEALIHHEEENIDHYLNTAWIMKSIRGIIIVGLVIPLAPHIASFFNEPRATDLIRVIVFSILILGLQNPGVVYFRKNLEFHKLFFFVSSATITNVSVAIGYALIFQNVWALVFGELAGYLTRLVVSYMIHDYRPRPEFDMEFAKELFGYGKWIMGSGILVFLYMQGDDIFVGWLLTATALGYYRIAYRFSNAPASELSQVVAEVAFPMYSKIQEDERKLRDAYAKVIKLSTFISFPAAVGIAVLAEPFVNLVLGPKWIPIVITMQLLAGWGFVHSFITTGTPLYNAIGKPDYTTKLRLITVLLIAVFIYPATLRWGIAGTAGVIFGSGTIVAILTIYLVRKTIDFHIKDVLYIISYPAMASLFMGICLIVLKILTPDFGLVKLLFLVIFGMIIYIIIIIGLDKWTDYDIRDTLTVVLDAVR